MENDDLAMYFIVESIHGERVHALLKREAWLEANIEPLRGEQNEIGFPLVEQTSNTLAIETVENELSITARVEAHPAVHRPPVDPHRRLQAAIQQWLTQNHPSVDATLLTPTKWEKLGELVLLPHTLSQSEAWQTVREHEESPTLWKAMAEALKVTSLGVQAPIADDTYRSAQVDMLLGTSQVSFTDHAISYTFDAAKVMFSSGNITERRRIGGLDMKGEVVVDAYAGVGYYTFPMLVHGGAAHVHACEINPASLEGLRAGATANALGDRLTVHEGDNAVSLATLRGLADRCHLGLLPSSEAVWEACLLALKPTGGTLHIHMNVEEERIETWVQQTVQRFVAMCTHHDLNLSPTVLHLERVKWFAPRVRHIVLDLSLRP
ncbi:MAG: hypothetical protein ACPG7K_00380 [Poseidonia sp.]